VMFFQLPNQRNVAQVKRPQAHSLALTSLFARGSTHRRAAARSR
jgi:hypothetical protein